MRNSASDPTHTHTHTHTPLYKASPIEGWRIMRKGHIFNICQMTEHPTAHVPVFKYPFSHSLSTFSFEEASHHPFLMSYPAPSPRSQSLDFLDCPLNSSPQLFLRECRVVPASRTCPYMHGGARYIQHIYASQVHGPIPSWQWGCTYHCPITQYTFSLSLAVFNLFKNILPLFARDHPVLLHFIRLQFHISSTEQITLFAPRMEIV